MVRTAQRDRRRRSGRSRRPELRCDSQQRPDQCAKRLFQRLVEAVNSLKKQTVERNPATPFIQMRIAGLHFFESQQMSILNFTVPCQQGFAAIPAPSAAPGGCGAPCGRWPARTSALHARSLLPTAPPHGAPVPWSAGVPAGLRHRLERRRPRRPTPHRRSPVVSCRPPAYALPSVPRAVSCRPRRLTDRPWAGRPTDHARLRR